MAQGDIHSFGTLTNFDLYRFTSAAMITADGIAAAFGTGSDQTIIGDGTDWTFDNTLDTGSTIFKLGTATTGTDFQVQNSAALALLTLTADGALDLDSSLDLDKTLTATGTAADVTLAYNSATGNSFGLQVSNVQTTTARTGDVATGLVVDLTSLAGDINSVEYNNLQLNVTDGGGTVVHQAINVGAGFDTLMDLSACATGEADIIVADNLASALQIRNATTPVMTVVTTDLVEEVAFAPQVTATKGLKRSVVSEFYDDFLADTAATIPTPWITNDTTANSLIAYVTGEGAGVLRMLSDGTSEAQAMSLTHGDTLMYNMDKNPIFECRFRLAPAGATLTADERLVIGMASAHANAEDTLDSVTSNCWFRIEAASLAIVVEIDDGTDVDDQASGVTLVKSAWTVVRIDFSSLADVKMYIDDVEQSGGALDFSGLGANTYLQPIVCIQRDAGAEVNSLDVDYIKIVVDR